MIRRALTLLTLLAGTSSNPKSRNAHAPLTAPPPVAREFRAAWATSIEDRGLRDWPSAPGLSPDSQRAELRTMLDRAAASGLNAVLLHVRMAGDAMYPTTYAPWSAALTGTSGLGPKPAYDPLAFAVTEAHARGLQLHAWFNPFRARLPGSSGRMAASHVTRAHPDWVRKYGSQTWIDPGNPAARAFVLATILDVVRRYDIDGVHIDDYFYPYRESETVTRRVHGRRVRTRRQLDFPDASTWKKYGKAKGYTDRDDWRRANVDSFVHALYTGVKAIKPWVVVGISPFGIWRSGSPPGVTGLDAYSEIFADSRHWLAEGWLDYLAPQLYWQLDGTQNRFRALDAWWRTQNPQRRYVWPGLYTSMTHGDNAWPATEIADEIASIRDSRIGSSDPPGHVHFRISALFAHDGRLASVLRDGVYREPALVPAFPWLGSTAPAAPKLSVVAENGPSTVVLAPGDTVPVRWWLVQTRDRSGHWSESLRPPGDDRVSTALDPDEVAVTAIGATGIASTPSLIAP